MATRSADRTPRWAVLLVGSIMWSAGVTASAWAGMAGRQWEDAARALDVVMLFAAGALPAFPVALVAGGQFARRRSAEAGVAAFAIVLAAATIGATAALYAVRYRSYEARWDADPFSHAWAIQLVFTILSASYQFAVLGLRLYLPGGFLALAAAVLWFARRSSRTAHPTQAG